MKLTIGRQESWIPQPTTGRWTPDSHERESMNIRYRYLDKQDVPLRCCPFCGASLTKPGGVTLTISIGDRPQDFATQLDLEGWLVDVERLVANGYHNATSCAACGEMLVDHEYSEDALESPPAAKP
jgi:hypothetical protein